MDSRKSKKTRSHGEVGRHSRDVSSSRPDAKLPNDRVKSAPVLPSPSKHKQDVRHRHVSQSSTEVSRSRAPSTTFSRPPSSIGNPTIKSDQLRGSSSSTYNDVSSESRRVQSSNTQSSPRDQTREVTVAVIGESTTGKSTFIHCALDLKRQMIDSSATKKVSLEGEVSTLRLLEVPMSAIGLSDDGALSLPLRVGGQEISHIDGALVIYDVMNRDSVERVPEVLSKWCFHGAFNFAIISRYSFLFISQTRAVEDRILQLTALPIATFCQSHVPALLVYTKCDNPQKTWHVTPEMTESICRAVEGIEAFQTSAPAPETHKRCISIILRNIIAKKGKSVVL